MTRRAALAALLLLAAGCVHYPTVMETGGVRIRTENGRAVRQGGDLVVTFDVVSSGKYGDTITGVVAPLAKQAVLVRGGGGALSRLEIPGAIVERSLTGLGIVVPMAFPRGTSLKVRLQHGNVSSLQVQVRHCRHQENQWFLGCQFTQSPPANVLMLLG